MRKTNLILMMVLIISPVVWAQGSLTLSPASGTYTVGGNWDMQILLDTGGEDVLTVQAYIDIGDPSKASVVGGDAGITVDSAFPLVVEKTVDLVENKIKIVAGVLGPANAVNGSSILIATVAMQGDAEGTAPFTFDQAVSQAQKADTTNVASTFNDASYTIGGGNLYDFDSDAEGWLFSGAIDTLDAPTDSVGDSCLKMQAVNNTNCFGFWYSPIDAIPELIADSIYRARFGINSDQADKSLVPSFRVRWNASTQKQGEYIMVNSNINGEASPDTTVVDYDLYFRPQADSLAPGTTAYLSYDLINLNPNDAADGQLWLDYVQVDRVAVADAGSTTSVQSYTFDANEEGWTSTPAISTFDQPIFTYNPGGWLEMQCDSSNNTFGFWQNPQDQIALNNSVLYQLRVKAGTDAGISKILQNEPPMIRVRMYDHPSNQMCSVMQIPAWTKYEEVSGSKQPVVLSDFYAYFANPLGVGPSLGIAIDIVNLDAEMSPTGLIGIDEVELSSLTIPTF